MYGSTDLAADLLSVGNLQVAVDRLVSASLHGLGQHLVALRPARAGRSHKKDTVTNSQQLRELYHSQDEIILRSEAHLERCFHNDLKHLNRGQGKPGRCNIWRVARCRTLLGLLWRMQSAQAC